MDIGILKTELTTDPLSRGYSGMTDLAAATDLNAAYRSRNRTSMTASEVVNAVNVAEYTALDAANKQLLWNIVHMGELNPFGVEATLITAIFGGGSNTIAALAVARVEAISRAVELGLPAIREGDVAKARSV